MLFTVPSTVSFSETPYTRSFLSRHTGASRFCFVKLAINLIFFEDKANSSERYRTTSKYENDAKAKFHSKKSIIKRFGFYKERVYLYFISWSSPFAFLLALLPIEAFMV